MSDIETVGWTVDKKFFILKINMNAFLSTDEFDALAVLYARKYSGDFSGCQFKGKLAVMCGDKVYINPWSLDHELSVDEPIEELLFSEFQKHLNS
ncbi:hypothetical protein [Acinetobacter pittii]|uniref:hypothetical protein n=1 Tax=Acinetobacter pittii TaxID=48296 RepID=UPI0008397EDA|nr:hypothetical protein [Acinetobacter pittii]OCY17619.1 hypothetical protein BFR65_15265 [Acinetobacter pittii]OCZ36159.1 hypothetical protein BFR71_13700 [Acinetobacter pittii]OCZ44264.1 hypothetical protein BFR72_10115 [Acinetobacter pittii]RSO01426.1 hypothetical protein EA765_01905 [Acinetobacter pittii]